MTNKESIVSPKITESPPKDKKLSLKLIYSALVASIIPLLHGISITLFTLMKKEADESIGSYFLPVFYGGGLVACIASYNFNLESTVVFFIIGLIYGISFGLLHFESIVFLFLNRFLSGFCGGLAGGVVCCYLSLIAPLKFRGIFSSLYVVAIISGLIINTVLSSFLRDYFRVYYLFLGFCGGLVSFLSLFCLKLFNSREGISLGQLLRCKDAYKSILLISLFHFANNFSGITTLSMSPKTIFTGIDDNIRDSYLAKILILGLVAALCSGYLNDMFGRKPLTILSSLSCLISSICFYLKYNIVIFAFVLGIGFNLGLGSIPYILIAEIFPSEFVSAGSLVGISVNYISLIFCTKIHSTDMDNPDPIFIYYVAYLILFMSVVLILFKETKGKKAKFQ